MQFSVYPLLILYFYSEGLNLLTPFTVEESEGEVVSTHRHFGISKAKAIGAPNTEEARPVIARLVITLHIEYVGTRYGTDLAVLCQ